MKELAIELAPPRLFQERKKTYENIFSDKAKKYKSEFEKLFGQSREDFRIGKLNGDQAIRVVESVFHLASARAWDLITAAAWLTFHSRYKIAGKIDIFPYIHGRSDRETLRKGMIERVSSVLYRYIGGTSRAFCYPIECEKLNIYSWIYPTIGIENFNLKNPVDNPEVFAYPWKHVTLSHLVSVYQLEDREGLIEKAEKERMNWFEFFDYVVNHVLVLNEELGYERYRIIMRGSFFIPFIKDIERQTEYEKINEGRLYIKHFPTARVLEVKPTSSKTELRNYEDYAKPKRKAA